MDVFLGSSKELFDQRLVFCALADTLADVALDACGEDVAARLWETESYAMERDRSKQAAYDELIEACDLAFFLVDGHLGAYTLHEFAVAVDAFERSGRPRVCAWVRPASEARAHDENTRQLLRRAEQAPAVEVRPLGEVHVLALEMLRRIAEGLGQLPLELRDGGVWAGRRRLVSLEGVPEPDVSDFAAWLERRRPASAPDPVHPTR